MSNNFDFTCNDHPKSQFLIRYPSIVHVMRSLKPLNIILCSLTQCIHKQQIILTNQYSRLTQEHVETKEQIQSEMYHSFITEMSIVYISPKVHIYPKVSKSTYISKSNQKYMSLHSYPSHMYMYPKLYKPHVHVSEMSMYMSPKVHVSKTIQATCTHVSICTYPIRHIKTQASSCSFSRVILQAQLQDQCASLDPAN